MTEHGSQIETTEKIKKLAKEVGPVLTPNDLIKIRDLIYSKLEIRPLDPFDHSIKEQEKLIRWKRTADQILEDGYVYNGKFCTDVTVLFIALCKALGLETNFVKVKKEKMTHSVAEVKINNDWYIFDVSNKAGVPEKGVITEDAPYKDWELWEKGRDAWDLGLSDANDIHKIF